MTAAAIGELPLGDLLVAAAVLAAGWFLAKRKIAPAERLIRRFERAFLPEGEWKETKEKS